MKSIPKQKEKWYKNSTVQGAMIGSVGIIIAAAIPLLVYFSENQKLKEENQQLQQQITQQIIEFQRLETEFIPFKTFAITHYTGTEAEALRQLAEQLTKLQASDLQRIQRIQELEAEIEYVKINRMLFRSHTITLIEKGYRIQILFESSKPQEPLGQIQIVVRLQENPSAKILTIQTCDGSVRLNVKSALSEDGTKAIIDYVPTVDPCIVVDISEKAKLLIEGNHQLKPFEINVN